MPLLALKYEFQCNFHAWLAVVEIFDTMELVGELWVEQIEEMCIIYRVTHPELEPGDYFIKPVWENLEGIEPFISEFKKF